MQQQFDQHSLEQTSVGSKDDVPRGPIVLSAEWLDLVSGGSPRGGWQQGDGPQPMDDAVQSPRGGW